MKIGLEIHQRLDSHKLFCSCPSISEEGHPDTSLSRKLHPVLSELGEIDEVSKQEFSKDKSYEYQCFHSCDCLVDADEEPPHPMNNEALLISLEICKQLGARVVDEIHVMRKIVIDGSNTSGFQRTALIAMNGTIETSKGNITLPFFSIEEESSGIVGREGNKSTYRLDRLGVPLIELSTTPDIVDGDHLLEVAEKIGMVLRATGKVARGLGTIRQDVNISTPNGARVEIKGAQDLKMLKTLVEIEEKRQNKLVQIYMKIKKDKRAVDFVDVSSLFSKTNSKMAASGLAKGESALAILLPDMKGIPGTEIQPGKRFGTELSEYAKTAGVKGIIHSDEDLSKYQFSEQEISGLRSRLGMKGNDAFAMVLANKEIARNALQNVIKRIGLGPVPEETRRANQDGTTTYMRPLPGRARLYPETDIPIITVDKQLLLQIEMSESLEQKKGRLEKMLNKEMAAVMLKSRNLSLFEKLAKKSDPMLVATTLENTIVSLRREGVEFAELEVVLTDVFDAYEKGKFVKAAIPEVLKGISKGQTISEAVEKGGLGKITGAELKKLVSGKSMAEVMAQYRLQVDPAEVQKIISKK
ncbi:MAG: Glu-tRNA(Gln) amidotransferase subunit GatE [Candidatus Micrarchaeota archaeon]